MASRFDDVTPHLNLKEHWHTTFDEMFQAFSPDEWTLEPTKTNMPKKWRQFKDGAKVKFGCECGNSWTSMAGRVIFWFKKIDESERRKEVQANGKKGKNEGKDGEDRNDSGNASTKETRNLYSLRFKVYGQQCRRCDDDDFLDPRWYREEVEKVLKNVHQKIGEAFYNFPSKEPDIKKRHGKMRRPHDSQRCQACREGHCRK
ncbi:receptor-transporting protein 3-like [Oculina patagonica]